MGVVLGVGLDVKFSIENKIILFLKLLTLLTPSLKSVTHIYNDDTCHSNTLPKEDPKNIYINHVTHPLISAGISIFSPDISNFCNIKKYKYRLHVNTYFAILLTFKRFLKVVLINMVVILMMSVKLANLGLLKKGILK